VTIPIRPTLSVRELCFALAHRWQPEHFMFVFTGYLDESGTHNDSPITVMGGIVARAEQWKHFEQGFAMLQKKHGFRVWHSKKFRQRKSDFKGWTYEQCSALYWDLANLSAHGLTDAVAVTLNNAEFEQHYKSGPKPNKARLDSKYGLCFRICLYHFMREVFKRRYKKKIPALHIVLEAGHPNFGDAERIFLEVKEDLEKYGNYMLGTITKAHKDSSGQLMIADFAAHGEYIADQKIPISQRQQIPTSMKIPKGMTGWTSIKVTAQELVRERAEIIEKATLKRRPKSCPPERARADHA
jgi:Protein of unknown function (DUF3800)